MSSKDMLGVAVRKLVTLPPQVLGTVCDLLEKMSDPYWVTAFKRFLRHENPWPEKTQEETKAEKPAAPPPVERWRKLSDMAIEVNLDAPLTLPFNGAKPEWQPPAGRGWVKVERVGDDLFVSGRKVIHHLEPEQKTGFLQGHRLRDRLQNRDTMDPRVLDALVEFENGRLIPESWKVDSEGRTLYHYFWEAGFSARDGRLCVRCLDWRDGQWRRDYDWLDAGVWDVRGPALLLAS